MAKGAIGGMLQQKQNTRWQVSVFFLCHTHTPSHGGTSIAVEHSHIPSVNTYPSFLYTFQSTTPRMPTAPSTRPTTTGYSGVARMETATLSVNPTPERMRNVREQRAPWGVLEVFGVGGAHRIDQGVSTEETSWDQHDIAEKEGNNVSTAEITDAMYNRSSRMPSENIPMFGRHVSLVKKRHPHPVLSGRMVRFLPGGPS